MKVNLTIVAKFNVANMSINAIRENKMLAKFSEFTVTIPFLKNMIRQFYVLLFIALFQLERTV